MPWNAGAPDPDLVRLVSEGRIPRGQALDLGTGTGHDAVYLIEQGFDVIAIDISPTAIHLARENASNHGLFAFFQRGDIRAIPVEDRWVDFANDRGCFHLLEGDDLQKAAADIARVVRNGAAFSCCASLPNEKNWKPVFNQRSNCSTRGPANSPAPRNAPVTRC